MAQYTPSAVKLTGALPDDGDLETTQPKICVDYLSHNWKEEDVWRSWRSMTRFKYEIANGMRLENASWRTWWKQRNKLGTVSPETLNWLKDSDVTWLYGPLHTAPEVTLKESSTADKLGVDIPKQMAKQPARSPPPPFTRNRTSSTSTKSILKQRSVTDILAAAVVPPRNPQHSSSPIYEQVAVEMEGTLNPTENELHFEEEGTMLPPAAGVLVPPGRPPLWHTKSDSFVTRQGMGVTLSTSPMSIKGLSPPGESAIVDSSKSASLSPPDHPRARHGRRSDSSSSYQVSDDSNAGPTRPKRHISFNSFVEQRIVIDPISTRLSTVYARSSSDSGSDDEEDDTILQMRSSSGSSLSSSRRGSTNSRTSSSELSSTSKLTNGLTMITARIAPTLLKEPDDLPAPSPAVVFVAPHGVDEEALKYEVHIASKPRFAVPADRKRIGDANWSPGAANWDDDGEEMLDYFSGVPLNGEPPEPTREPIYTDEDEDAITLRTRQRGQRSPRLNGAGVGEPMSPSEEQSSPITPETAHPIPRRSSFAKKSQQDFGSSPPTISHEEVARLGANDASPISKPLGVPRRAGSGSDIQFGGSSWSSGGSVGSAPRSSQLSASMSSMRSGRSGTRNRAPSASFFEGIDMAGHTSALSGRAGSESTISPPRDGDMPDTRGRGRDQRIQEEMERPRRGRSLLRTGSSSTISERERSSTTGSSSSPMGSLSPRSTSSVGIVGGYIVPPSGLGSIIVPSGSAPKSSSGLRYESGSWSAEEEHEAIDGGDFAQVSPTRSKPAPPSGGLIRVSSSSNVSQTSTQTTPRVSGIRRTNSSTNVTAKASGLQRTSSSSNIFSSTAQSNTTNLITSVPVLTLQPPSSQGISFEGLPHADSPGFGSASGSASHSPEDSTGSFWKANELELESPATPPSPAEMIPTPSGPFEEPSLHRDLLLNKNSIKPRASGMSLASSTSNGSNESSATVVPKNSKAAKRLSSQLASASSSISSNSSFTSAGHRRSGSKSSVASVGPPTPPMAIRSTAASSGSTLSVTQAVATRSEVGSPVPTSTRRHLRKLSGGVSTPAEDKSSPAVANPSPISVSPGSMLSHVVGNAKGFFDALWGGNGGDHSG